MKSPESERKQKRAIESQIKALKNLLREKRRELIILSQSAAQIDNATKKV